MKQEEKIGFFEKFGFGLGDTASNLFWMTFIYFMSYFYTDVFGITAAAAGTMFAVTRIWDAFVDPAFGILGDRTNTRWGKFRPYLIWMVIPYGVIGVFTFITPNFSMDGKIIYAYLTYTLMMMVYSAINIPYGSLMAVVSSNPLVRTQFSQYRFILAFTGGLIVQGATLPMVNYFGGNETSVIQAKLNNYNSVIINEKGEGTTKLTINIKDITGKSNEEKTVWNKTLLVLGFINDTKSNKSLTVWVTKPENFTSSQTLDSAKKILYLKKGFKSYTLPTTFLLQKIDLSKSRISLLVVNERKGFQNAMTVFAVLAVIFFIITFLSTKERVKPSVTQETSIGKDIKDLLKNGPWVLLFFMGIFTLTHVCLRNGSIIYYFKYYIGNKELASFFMIAGTIATLAAIPLTGWAAKMFGKKRTYIFLMFITTVISISFFFIDKSHIGIIFTLQILANFFFGPTAPLVFAMYTDSADYSEWKTGRRATGLVMSASTMAQKFGWAIGGALTGWMLAAFGFVANVEQSADTIFGIKSMMSWVPAISSALAGFMMLFYKLNEKKMSQIEMELNQRRAEEVKR